METHRATGRSPLAKQLQLDVLMQNWHQSRQAQTGIRQQAEPQWCSGSENLWIVGLAGGNGGGKQCNPSARLLDKPFVSSARIVACWRPKRTSHVCRICVHGLLFGPSLCRLDAQAESCAGIPPSCLISSAHALLLPYVQQDGRRVADKRTNKTERNPKRPCFILFRPPRYVGTPSLDLVFNLDAQSGGSAPLPHSRDESA